VCAIHAAAFMPEFRVSRGLAAQVFNSDRLLQETAAWVIYNKDNHAFQAIRERLPNRDKRFLDTAIENNQLLEGLDDGFFLGIEMVMFIKQLPTFRNIHGSILSDLADKITPIELELGDRLKFDSNDHNSPIFIIAHGEVKLKNNDLILTTFKKGSVYGDLFQDGPAVTANALEASERTVIFRINLMDFYFVMANHHELVQGLIKNITENKQEYSQLNP
jgi:AAA family ATP:ADP antiporter